MDSSIASVTNAQPVKFSRYRSVRRATISKGQEDVPPVPSAADLNRKPSRYRRTVRPPTQTSPPLPKLETTIKATGFPPIPHTPISPARQVRGPPIQPAAISPIREASPKATQYVVDGRFFESGVSQQRALSNSTGRHERILSRSASTSARPSLDISRSYEAAREEARMILEGEYDRLQKMKDIQKRNEQSSRAVAPTRSARPRATTVNDKRNPIPNPSPNPNPAVARFDPSAFVDAPRKLQTPNPLVKAKTMPTPQPIALDHAPKPRKLDAPTRVASAKLPVKFDAPVSAVNAGDRRVEVRCSGASSIITLPVTPTTTARDLLNSASICISESFDPRTAILVECFSSADLERPLRRYEHIRDVMNSWDTDAQNHLVIMSETECSATGLDQKEVPLSQPVDIKIQMSMSPKLGKWEKKWVLLRSDGQIAASKHENGGDAINICHLSDFDVYTPTSKQAKKIKAPKKHCFAIKSLQKSATFLEGTNFVHFFSTNDKQTADRWYKAVQSWRSWYLVNILGEGTQSKACPDVLSPGEKLDLRPLSSSSQEKILYQLGSFKPLLDFDHMEFGNSQDQLLTNGGHTTKSSVDFGNGPSSMDQRRSIDVRSDRTRHGLRQTRVPPSALPSTLLAEARNKIDLGLDNDDQAFTGTGLLARSATKRSHGGNATGHGAQGSKGRPLVDLMDTSEFAEGSLLRQLETWTASQGDQDPKNRVDRQRRVEVDVRVGEGL